MSLQEYWDGQADAWAAFARTDGHDVAHARARARGTADRTAARGRAAVVVRRRRAEHGPAPADTALPPAACGQAVTVGWEREAPDWIAWDVRPVTTRTGRNATRSSSSSR